MPRHTISTVHFDPYTYQELQAPIERATAVLSQQAQGLSTLEMQNAALSKYLDPETDAAEYEIYKQNEAALRQASDSLLKNGLNSNTFNLMRDASMAYARDIRPMQEAAVNRMQYNSKIAEILASNPDTVVKGPMKHSLKEFYNGVPQPEFIKGSLIQNDVATVMNALANARSTAFKSGSIDKYNDIITSLTGYTYAEYQQLMNDPNSLVQKVMHDIMQKYGAEDANGVPTINDADYGKMWQYATMGSYGLIGKTNTQVRDSSYSKQQAEARANRSLALQERAYEDGLYEKALQLYGTVSGTVDEIYNGLKNHTLNLGTSANQQTSPAQTYMQSQSYSFVTPSVTANENPVLRVGSNTFDYKQIARSGNDAALVQPKSFKNGIVDWSNLNDFKPFNTKSGDKALFGWNKYVNRVANSMGYKLDHLTMDQYRALQTRLQDLAKNADIAIPNYSYTFSSAKHGKTALLLLSNSFIGTKDAVPSADVISKAQTVILNVDCNNPNILNVKVNGALYKADLTNFLNQYSSYDAALQNQFDAAVAVLKRSGNDKNSTYLDTQFWNSDPITYANEAGNFYSIIGHTLDALITDIADRTVRENNAFKETQE